MTEDDRINIHVSLLTTTIQTNAAAEASLEQTITQLRLFALTIVVGILTLGHVIKEGQECYAILGIGVIVSVLWGCDVFCMDMMRRYKGRSLKVIARLNGFSASDRFDVPPMDDHSLKVKFLKGRTSVQFIWYILIWAIGVAIVLFQKTIFTLTS